MEENNVMEVESIPTYQRQAKTITIKATSRLSCKLKDVYYTFEYTEERSVPDRDEVLVDMEAERKFLWDKVNDECYNQVDEVFNANEERENEIKKQISQK